MRAARLRARPVGAGVDAERHPADHDAGRPRPARGRARRHLAAVGARPSRADHRHAASGSSRASGAVTASEQARRRLVRAPGALPGRGRRAGSRPSPRPRRRSRRAAGVASAARSSARPRSAAPRAARSSSGRASSSPARRPGRPRAPARCRGEAGDQPGPAQAASQAPAQRSSLGAPRTQRLADVLVGDRSLPSRSAIVRATRSTRSQPRPLSPSRSCPRASIPAPRARARSGAQLGGVISALQRPGPEPLRLALAGGDRPARAPRRALPGAAGQRLGASGARPRA